MLHPVIWAIGNVIQLSLCHCSRKVLVNMTKMLFATSSYICEITLMLTFLNTLFKI